MICIFRGPPPANLTAQDIQQGIESQVALCQHDHTLQERQDVCCRATERLETSDEMYVRQSIEEGVTERVYRQLFPGEQPSRMVKTGETREQQVVRISPDVVKLDGSPVTLADFPPGFAFGNGVTSNTAVPLRNGDIIVMSWVVFDNAQEANVNASYAALRQLVEG